MTLATLAIHAEAWLQEELGAQRALLAALERLDAAARSGSSAELERGGRELEAALGTAGARDARRTALLSRLGKELGLAPGDVALSRVSARLAEARLETHRLDALRAELRETLAAVLRAGRRLAAVARVHRGLLEDVLGLFSERSPASGGLVDARG